MKIALGDRIGPYEIVAPLGRGGMGEVWRARDARLSRDVAIKALPDELARDPDRRARFDREARVLAALNHPNVTAIYGVEEKDAASYLVLELVEGQTLEQRLETGPLPLDDALVIAAQIATGLEAAHEAGIVHRDLKPANVKIRPDGSVKILDLGLARTTESSSARSEGSVTSTLEGTLPGVILGTAAYMSPEQARGKPVDRRTDIFAFGCLLYECLTGGRAFATGTLSDALVAVMTAEPDWSALPQATPASLGELLRRCLRKDPRQRLQSIADARVVIEEISSGTASEPTSPAVSTARQRPVVWIVAAASLLAGLLVGGLVARAVLARRPVEPTSVTPAVHAVLPLGGSVTLTFAPDGRPTIAISPDGLTVVFRGTEQGLTRLYRRALDGDASTPIPGTEGGTEPFFSPDGQWLGFIAAAKIKKVAVAGGAPLDVCEVSPVASGATWSDDGWIVFSRGINGPLSRVSPAGGAADRLTTLDRARGEHAHVWPQALPGGRLLVTTILGRDFQDLERAQAVIVSPNEKPRVVIEGSSFARIVPGWIVFVRGTAILAAPFDEKRLESVGPPIAVREPVVVDPARQTAFFAVSPDGTLVFATGTPVQYANANVVRVDRSGNAVTVPLGAARYVTPRLSPDGARLAITRFTGMAMRLFIFDFAREVLTPLTPEPGRYFGPAWSPDGKQIAYAGFNEDEPRAYVKNADGSGASTPLIEASADAIFPNSWFPDGKTIASIVSYTDNRGDTRLRGTQDILITPVDPRGPSVAWFETRNREIAPTVSPDGHFIAYVSDESGASEVYVRAYPGTGGKVQISNNGGTEPTWSREGREILYRRGDDFMSVEFRATPQILVSAARVLFAAPLQRGSREDIAREYDVSRDGNAIIALRVESRAPANRQLAIVTNWSGTLARAASRE